MISGPQYQKDIGTLQLSNAANGKGILKCIFS